MKVRSTLLKDERWVKKRRAKNNPILLAEKSPLGDRCSHLLTACYAWQCCALQQKIRYNPSVKIWLYIHWNKALRKDYAAKKKKGKEGLIDNETEQIKGPILFMVLHTACMIWGNGTVSYYSVLIFKHGCWLLLQTSCVPTFLIKQYSLITAPAWYLPHPSHSTWVLPWIKTLKYWAFGCSKNQSTRGNE